MKSDAKSPGQAAGQGGAAFSAAWPDFELRLASVLEVLEEDQYLVISLKRGWAYVQFAAQGFFGLRAESVSNNFLDEANRLGEDQVAALLDLGWRSPTGPAREASAKKQPDGSPNFFLDFPKPVPFSDVARLAVRTLAEVFEIPHPGHLNYNAFDRNQKKILLPTLGLAQSPSVPSAKNSRTDTVEQVQALVLKALRKASGNHDLEFSEENHRLPLRFGSALVLVRVEKDPFCVSVYSPLLVNVDVGHALVGRLNELNSRVRFARLFEAEGTVYAATEISASPCVTDHVISACEMLGRLADDIDEMLQAEFGGRTAFGEFRSTTPVN